MSNPKPLLGPCDSYQLEPDLAKRFWLKVRIDKPDKCWIWNGAVSSNGYGSIGFRNNICGAHRVAAYLSGIISSPVWAPSRQEKTLVLHTCDNTLCCNPRHLYAGNFQDNSDDKYSKSRSNNVRGEQHYCSKLTNEQVLDIRRSYSKNKNAYAEVGRKYGVSSNAIRKVVLGLSYSHLL